MAGCPSSSSTPECLSPRVRAPGLVQRSYAASRCLSPRPSPAGVVGGIYTFSGTADYAFRVANNQFGFVDRDCEGYGRSWSDTHLELGSLGTFEMPVSAATCWAVVAIAVVTTFTLVGWLVCRRARVGDDHSRQSPRKENEKFAAGERGR
jgi:hypothetical protein